MSAIRLTLTPKEGQEAQPVTQWLTFSQYPHVDPRSARITFAGRQYEIIYSRLERDLGVTLIPNKLSVKFFPGRQNVESWRSDFLVQASPGAAPAPAAVYTNETCAAGAWTLFQSGAAADHWSYTILGVGNRNGIGIMTLGCVLVTLGSLYAFYIKPVLTNRRKQAALQAGTSPASGDPPRGESRRPEGELDSEWGIPTASEVR
jgi:hypothetical protein